MLKTNFTLQDTLNRMYSKKYYQLCSKKVVCEGSDKSRGVCFVREKRKKRCYNMDGKGKVLRKSTDDIRETEGIVTSALLLRENEQ